MELIHYLKNPSQLLEQSDSSVILFSGAIYPHIFFMQLFEKLKADTDFDIKTIDIQGNDFAYKSQLATSFLGMSCVYWLADTSMMKAPQKDELLSYLATYQGPHKVMMFVDAKTELAKNKAWTVIAMQDKYFLQDAKQLFMSEDLQKSQRTGVFLQQIYKIKNSFTLDELSLLENYQNLITHDSQEFYASWVTRLVIPDTSLFTLSQLLFEKKEEQFFKLWLQIKPLYADMFWISFWSDQLYRSYFFIAFTQDQNFAAVKQVSFGLSFSFMKQSYKQYQLGELERFHQALYGVDTALKNGGNSYQIDQLFVDFFVGNFKRQFS